MTLATSVDGTVFGARAISIRGPSKQTSAMRVSEGLSQMPFADALAIQAAQGDACARDWTKQSNGTFSKAVRLSNNRSLLNRE